MEGDAFPAKGKSRRAFAGRRLEVGWRPRSHFGLVNVDIPAKSTHYFRKAASSLDLRRELAARAWPRGVGAGEQGAWRRPRGRSVLSVPSSCRPSRPCHTRLVSPRSRDPLAEILHFKKISVASACVSTLSPDPAGHFLTVFLRVFSMPLRSERCRALQAPHCFLFFSFIFTYS